MDIFRVVFSMAVFISSGFWGGPQNRGLPYYKSVGIRDLFGSIEGGALPGGPLLPTRAKRSKSGSFGEDPTSTCFKTVKICKN